MTSRLFPGLLAGIACWLHAQAALNPILAWDDLMLHAIRADNSAPTLASRNLAILTVAMFDAVNSIERTHLPAEVLLPAPDGTSPRAAAHAAAHTVLLGLYPSFQARINTLWNLAEAELRSEPGWDTGVLFGRDVARLVLESRQADGSNTQVPYIPSDLPGQWRRTPPFHRPPLDPNWRLVELFSLPALEPFLPPGPPPLDSAAYAVAFNEVKLLGQKGSIHRSAEESQIASFWADFSNTATPPGHWHEIAADIVRDSGLSLTDIARMFALLGMAQSDAAVVIWDAKYHHNFWRPVTAIERADEDGNPATEKSPEWQSFLDSPPFPEYTSGHSTFSHVSARVLAWFLGSDNIAFTARSDTLPGVVRSFSSLDACAKEVGQSRIFGGIHFSFANRDGKIAGRNIAAHVTANALLPVDLLPRVTLSWNARERRWDPRLHTRLGVPAVVETSTNLITWTPIHTNSAPPGGLQLEIPSPPSSTSRFFRAVQPPAP